MANISNSKIIKLWVLRPYGHGWADYRGKGTNYVDYFLEDLAEMLIEQDKVDALGKWIEKKVSNEG